MSESPMIIVVAGARGNLGKLVCDAVLRRAAEAGLSVVVRGLVRRDGRSQSETASIERSKVPLNEGFTIQPVDYGDQGDLQRACAGAHTVVSTLQGFDDVIVDVQSRLLQAAIDSRAERFIPSDFALDFTKLPPHLNRNFDMRLRFHQAAQEIIQRARSAIQLTSIYQGGFAEALASGWILFSYKKRRVQYFGSADAPMDFTTWRNTAEFTAAVALDPEPTPRTLHIAGQRISPRQASEIAKRATGVEFPLQRVMSLALLRALIAIMRFLMPAKNNLMPPWVGLQYAHTLALGLGAMAPLDNARYPDISWEGIEPIVGRAFRGEPV